MWEICIEWERKCHIYSSKMGIKIVKIKWRGRDRWRVTLSLRVVERWKDKREVMVGSNGEKWGIGRWCGGSVATINTTLKLLDIYIYIYIVILPHTCVTYIVSCLLY